jgi:hypothetical protein
MFASSFPTGPSIQSSRGCFISATSLPENGAPEARGSEIHNMREAGSATRCWRRRLAGWLWFCLWMVLLWTIASPWRHLGGLVSERMRWMEGFSLASALTIGCCVGALSRDTAMAGRGRSHAGLLHWLLLPPAALAAITLVVLRLMKLHDPIGVVFTAFMAYWAGVDIAFGAYPLMKGRHYSFRGPIRRSERSAGPRDLSPWLGG